MCDGKTKMAINTINILKNTESNTKSFYVFKQVLASIASGLIMLSAGMAYGFSGVLLPKLVVDKTITYDRSYDSWVASILPLSSVFACLAAGPLIEKFGRKCGLILILFPLILGWLLLAFAKSVVLLLVGRFLTGICTGGVRPCALVYLGEIFDPKYRGTALFSLSLTMHVGVLFCHFISNYVYWRTCCFIFIGPSLVGLFVLLYLKESPIWFILKERVDEGVEIFKWFRGNSEASQRELNEIVKKQKGKAEITKTELMKFVFSKSFMKPFLTMTILFLSVQFLGLNNISFYAEDIVRDTFSTEVDTFTMVMAIDVTRVISSVIMCFVIDKLPRKITFLICSFTVCMFVFSIVILLYLDTTITWLLIVCMLGYIIFGNAIVSYSWSFLPEIFPGKVRGFASGMGSAINFATLFLSVNITPRLSSYGQDVLFTFYGICTLVGTLFLCFLLPETKGKTLQEIEDDYVNNDKFVSTHL